MYLQITSRAYPALAELEYPAASGAFIGDSFGRVFQETLARSVIGDWLGWIGSG
jgi:hypothetical protein